MGYPPPKGVHYLSMRESVCMSRIFLAFLSLLWDAQESHHLMPVEQASEERDCVRIRRCRLVSDPGA